MLLMNSFASSINQLTNLISLANQSTGNETFHKFLSEFCVSPTIHVLWPNLSKIGRCEVAEKSSGIAYKRDTCPGHFLAPISPTQPIAPKIS